jgi:hypothetical protein
LPIVRACGYCFGQNWPQQRSLLTGAVRALLKIIAANPRVAIETLRT